MKGCCFCTTLLPFCFCCCLATLILYTPETNWLHWSKLAWQQYWLWTSSQRSEWSPNYARAIKAMENEYRLRALIDKRKYSTCKAFSHPFKFSITFQKFRTQTQETERRAGMNISFYFSDKKKGKQHREQIEDMMKTWLEGMRNYHGKEENTGPYTDELSRHRWRQSWQSRPTKEVTHQGRIL